MTSIVAENADSFKRRPFRRRGLWSTVLRLFSNKRLSRTKSDSKLSIDYEHFYITEAPRSKTFSESHTNPQINFDEEGKLAQTEEMVLEESIPTIDDKSQPKNHNIGQDYELPVTSIDDIDAASDFEAY